jgi:hypothetical protein
MADPAFPQEADNTANLAQLPEFPVVGEEEKLPAEMTTGEIVDYLVCLARVSSLSYHACGVVDEAATRISSPPGEGLAERSSGYARAWLANEGDNEAVPLPSPPGEDKVEAVARAELVKLRGYATHRAAIAEHLAKTATLGGSRDYEHGALTALTAIVTLVDEMIAGRPLPPPPPEAPR